MFFMPVKYIPEVSPEKNTGTHEFHNVSNIEDSKAISSKAILRWHREYLSITL